MTRQDQGFTLIEVMIVVAVVAILAMIAFPAYQDQIRKSRRGTAISTLQDLALQQERWRANDSDYATLAELGGASNDYYAITVTENTASRFTLQAVAQGGQAADDERGTSCTTLTLDQSNTRTPAACW